MISSIKYSYVNARVKSRAGELLEEKDLIQLMESESLGEVLSLLADTPYADELSKLPESPTVEEVETALYSSFVDDFITLTNSAKEESKDFLMELLRKFEVEDLKAILRMKHARVTEEISLFPSEKVFRRGLRKLLEASDVSELVALLEGTMYKDILERELPEYEKEGRILSLEIALDNDLYDALRRKMDALSFADEHVVQRLIGILHGSTNIMTTLRCKLGGIDAEEFRKYLLPYGYGIEIKDLLVAEDVKSAILSLPSEPYGRILSEALPKFEDTGSLVPLELALRKVLLEESKRYLAGDPFNIGTIMSFLNLKEIEMKNLRTIVASRGELTAEKVRELVVL